MGCFKHIIMSGQNQSCLHGVNGFAFIHLVQFSHPVDIGHIKIISAVLSFSHQVDITVGALGAPLDILEMADTLQGHGNPFEPVGQFH